jgi:hypothetical protein
MGKTGPAAGGGLEKLEIHDGPFLELGLKGILGQAIQLPRRTKDRPDRERLAQRFEHSRRLPNDLNRLRYN